MGVVAGTGIAWFNNALEPWERYVTARSHGLGTLPPLSCGAWSSHAATRGGASRGWLDRPTAPVAK